jgi:1-acyl-sn-glycerol-3-phosphate acyltransferase
MPAGELNPWWRAGLPVVGWLVRLFFKVRVEGIEHVPPNGPAILAFNHVSSLDGPVLAIEVARRIRRETRFLVAAEFFAKRRFGWILRTYDQIPIRRGAGDVNALEEAVATIRQGALAAIAPEGTVNDDGAVGLQRIRAGTARVALPTGAPIVPVGIWGTQRRWPRSGLRHGRPFRPRLGIVFGPPILPTGDVASQDDVADLSERLGSRIQRQVDRAMELTGDAS